MNTELYYCADGNRRFAEIAIQQGFLYGAQLPNTIYFQPHFVDQNWKSPNRAAYMAALKEYRPALATVLDFESDDQFSEVMAWADEAARYVDTVIIIPKVMGGVPRIPETVRGKPVRLGYSVPTSFGGTCLPVWEFGRRPVHLLGGSPGRQLELANYLNVQSIDGNYSGLMARQYGQFYANNKQGRGKSTEWPKLNEYLDTSNLIDVPYYCFRLSHMNIRAAWLGCRAMLRYATENDIDAIKKIANQYKNELGFVNSAALKDSIKRFELYVAEYLGSIVGFVNWHKRRDGWSTIYEIATDKAYTGQHIGRALLESVPQPRRLKCTVDNARANGFYAHSGGMLARVEAGKKRMLNVWQWGGVGAIAVKEAA